MGQHVRFVWNWMLWRVSFYPTVSECRFALSQSHRPHHVLPPWFCVQVDVIEGLVLSPCGSEFPRAVIGGTALMTLAYVLVGTMGYHQLGASSEYLMKWDNVRWGHIAVTNALCAPWSRGLL